MQRLFARHEPTPPSYEVRPATSNDRAALNRLTERARRVHFHLDWKTIDDWLGTPAEVMRPGQVCLLALSGRQIAGALIGSANGSPVAWVRLVAIADGHDGQAVLGALLEPAVDALLQADVESLACLAHPDWLAGLLPVLGFSPFIDVTNFAKEDRAIPKFGAPGVTIRRAQAGDLPAVLENDRAAFDPIWWHSGESLERILKEAAYFVVAEIDGRVIGHAFSDVYGGRGHLVRLAVHPDGQGRGVGTRLLAESLMFLIAAGAHPLTLNTQANNYTSQSLYRRFGYAPAGDSTTVMLRHIGRDT